MAVPFYVPDADEQRNVGAGGGNGSGGNTNNSSNESSASQTPSTTTSATQTPLQSPVSGEHLVQAFYEALYRYSNSMANQSGSPIFPSPPQSPSCSSANSMGYFVFPCTNASTPRSSGLFFESRFAWDSPRNSVSISRRRLNSTGEEVDGEDDDDTEQYSEDNDTIYREEFEEHFLSLSAREHLQMFPGCVPSKKKTSSKNGIRHSDTKTEVKSKSKDQKFAWPTVVTAVVLAVGCGFLVTR